jgi:hypothetical protein
MGSRLVVVVASMNHLRSRIEDLSTHEVTQRKRPIVQTTIVFVGEHNYEQPHTNDGISILRDNTSPNKLSQNIQGEISLQPCMGQTF